MLFVIAAAMASLAHPDPSLQTNQPVIASAQGTTQVKLRLTETLSSASAKVGQVVWLEVVDPVKIDNKVIIQAGTRARGTVTQVRKRGHNRREGQLQFTVLTVSETDGREARLQSATVQKGSGEGQPIFGPCTFPLPADPVGLFRKGQDVVIPKGTELTALISSHF